MSHPLPAASEAAEAARYALLRRLAPSMRHHLVVHLQPIGMVYEIIERRLASPEPDVAQVHAGARKINDYARAALASCVDIVTWLAPEPGAPTTVPAGTRELLGLVQTSFTFRGYTVRDEVGDVPGVVQRSAFRNVVTAALLHLSDVVPAPAQITLGAHASGSAVEVVLTAAPAEGQVGFTTAPTYRPLSWDDVQALAEADGVGLSRSDSQVRISLPRAA